MANSRRLKKLIEYLRPHWRPTALGVFSLLLVNAVGVYIPLLIRNTIDQLRTEFTVGQLLQDVGILLLLASIMWGIRMISRVSIFGVGRQVEFDLKQKIFGHLLILESSYFAINSSGDLINRATSDVDNIRRLLGFAVLSIANIIFAYGLTLPVMLWINIPMTLAAVAVYPVMLITVQLFSEKLRFQQQNVQENLSEISELIQEDISGINLIKIYAQEEQQRVAFRAKNINLLEASLKLARTRNLLFPLIEGLAQISLIILLSLGIGAISSNVMSVGDFLALLIYVERLVFPTALLGFTITAYQRGEVSLDRIEGILQEKPKITTSPDALVLAPDQLKGEITAKHLSYTYPGAKNPALNDINFAIAPGETIAVVGSIGSGKSTLANLFSRLLDLHSNQLFLDGYDITKIRLEDLRKAIAFVPQDSFLFSTTIANNIRYGDPDRKLDDVEDAAKQSQIHPEIVNFPQQYETIVGERGITLSGGQRQRTSLARALLVDSRILVLDDALSSVDNETATAILHNLSSVQNKTVIFISHNLSAAANADRILVLDQGQIVQMGSHEDMVDTPGLYQELWQQHNLKQAIK